LKPCNVCQQETRHRWTAIKGRKGGGQFQCIPCIYKRNTRWRKLHWEYDLARKANLRRRSGSVLMTEAMIHKLCKRQEGQCALSGHPFDIDDARWRPSLDRIDASKGYTTGNIQLVAWIVNRSKSRFSDAVFREVCSAVAETTAIALSNTHQEAF
jgi:hypothetical protein